MNIEEKIMQAYRSRNLAEVKRLQKEWDKQNKTMDRSLMNGLNNKLTELAKGLR